jgi:putative glutamine amidotransferase
MTDYASGQATESGSSNGSGKTVPIIGITAGLETAKYGGAMVRGAFISNRYLDAVQRAGGRAVILTPDEYGVVHPEVVLESVDAVMVSGGACDVDPVQYGQEKHPATNPGEAIRDRFEIALARAAVEHDVPLLGVCRGMQILNVAYGGNLHQHIPDVVGHDEHQVAGIFTDHEVRLQPGSLAESGVGSDETTVKSSHHQGVNELGDGLQATGWSIGDEMVEAIEDPERAFVLGVQWHPEEDPESLVIGSLVEQARHATRVREQAHSRV